MRIFSKIYMGQISDFMKYQWADFGIEWDRFCKRSPGNTVAVKVSLSFVFVLWNAKTIESQCVDAKKFDAKSSLIDFNRSITNRRLGQKLKPYSRGFNASVRVVGWPIGNADRRRNRYERARLKKRLRFSCRQKCLQTQFTKQA